MAFLPSIPQATDILANSQGDILNNFTILGAIAGNSNVGSATINSVAGFNQLNLASQGTFVPSFNGNNGLWSGTYAVTGKQEVWLNYQNGNQYPITASILSNLPTTAYQDGWTYLPSGLIFKWGSSTTGTSGAFTYNMPTGATIPVFSKVFNASVTLWETAASDTNHAVRLVNFTNTQISLWGSQRTTTTPAIVGFIWYAIGSE